MAKSRVRDEIGMRYGERPPDGKANDSLPAYKTLHSIGISLDDIISAVQIDEEDAHHNRILASQLHIVPLGKIKLGELQHPYLIAMESVKAGGDFESLANAALVTLNLDKYGVIPEEVVFIGMESEQLGHLARLLSDVTALREYREGAERSDTSAWHSIMTMVSSAASKGVSDIHMIPTMTIDGIEYHVDWRRSSVYQRGRWTHSEERGRQIIMTLINRSGLDPTTKEPQRGDLDFRSESKADDTHVPEEISDNEFRYLENTRVRVSIVNSKHGLTAVLRLLDTSAGSYEIEGLGYSSYALRRFEQLLHITQGIVLVTGPTGSGKTKTLYTMINALKKQDGEDRKVMTLENPVEAIIPDTVQISSKPDQMAEYIEHFLQQDPDVIMIGEIRDPLSAKIALDASNTGHVVLGTVHANTAIQTIQRMYGLGVDRGVLAEALKGVVSQRLFRKICQECAVDDNLDNNLRDLGITYDPTATLGIRLFKPSGCAHCFKEGYQGRAAMAEIMLGSEGLSEAILNNDSFIVLRQLAGAGGMRSLYVEGIAEVLRGRTSFAELRRVLGKFELRAAAGEISEYLNRPR